MSKSKNTEMYILAVYIKFRNSTLLIIKRLKRHVYAVIFVNIELILALFNFLIILNRWALIEHRLVTKC